MEQYKKSGPPQDKKAVTDANTEANIERLRHRCDEQDKVIKELQKEIRKLKSKLDAHADVIGRIKRG